MKWSASVVQEGFLHDELLTCPSVRGSTGSCGVDFMHARDIN